MPQISSAAGTSSNFLTIERMVMEGIEIKREGGRDERSINGREEGESPV